MRLSQTLPILRRPETYSKTHDCWLHPDSVLVGGTGSVLSSLCAINTPWALIILRNFLRKIALWPFSSFTWRLWWGALWKVETVVAEHGVTSWGDWPLGDAGPMSFPPQDSCVPGPESSQQLRGPRWIARGENSILSNLTEHLFPPSLSAGSSFVLRTKRYLPSDRLIVHPLQAQRPRVAAAIFQMKFSVSPLHSGCGDPVSTLQNSWPWF